MASYIRIPPPHERSSKNRVPKASARCTKPIPDAPDLYPESFSYNEQQGELLVGSGVVTPVAPEVWEYQVSGLRVVHSWLAYRMRAGAGRTSSSLDLIRPERWVGDMTSELLELLWVIEHTIAIHPDQAFLTQAIADGPLIAAVDLPPVSDLARKPPREVSLPVDDVDPMP